MKPRLKLMGIGAGAGAGLLLLFWLLRVVNILALTLQDSSFFLGLVLFLIGLLIIVRGTKTSAFTEARRAARSGNKPEATELAKKPDREPGEIRKAPWILMGAGLLNLIICALTFLI